MAGRCREERKLQEDILEELRSRGCRITRQREMLVDIILEHERVCCKEIYYLAVKEMPDIGMATVYRMINTLEEIGVLKRENAYRLCEDAFREEKNCLDKGKNCN